MSSINFPFINSLSRNKAASIFIALIIISSCNNSNKLNPAIAAEKHYFSAIANNDVKLSTAKKGEWRFEHKEAIQTFESYRMQSIKNIDTNRNTIYLKPIGKFTFPQEQALELTRLYLSIFFQTKTVLLEVDTDSDIPNSAKRLRDNHFQLLAPYLLDSVLMQQVPKNAHALMAFTAKDLYPSNNWNYIFGLASYQNRVGVSSIYRLQSADLNRSESSTFLRRLLSVSSHEIGHMFSISHCAVSACVMNGGNSLKELDLQPNRLCAECQKKLFWRLRYNNKKRLEELCRFLSENHLKHDYELLASDLKALK
ncbi:archaemetzincin [Pedobacter sp.]